MHTVDAIVMHAPIQRVFEAASDVERWPEILAHYRWVRTLERHADWDLVEMAAWRPFGIVNYPTWWVSEMRRDPERSEIRYRHVRGITRGMDVVWSVKPIKSGVQVSIVHTWSGPAWPLLGAFAAAAIIGPIFIHGIASRTLAGLRNTVEALTNA